MWCPSHVPGNHPIYPQHPLALTPCSRGRRKGCDWHASGTQLGTTGFFPGWQHNQDRKRPKDAAGAAVCPEHTLEESSNNQYWSSLLSH